MAMDLVGGEPLHPPWPHSLLGVRAGWLPRLWSPRALARMRWLAPINQGGAGLCEPMLWGWVVAAPWLWPPGSHLMWQEPRPGFWIPSQQMPQKPVWQQHSSDTQSSWLSLHSPVWFCNRQMRDISCYSRQQFWAQRFPYSRQNPCLLPSFCSETRGRSSKEGRDRKAWGPLQTLDSLSTLPLGLVTASGFGARSVMV